MKWNIAALSTKWFKVVDDGDDTEIETLTDEYTKSVTPGGWL